MQMENVFATAIGLYRIRKDDLDYSHYRPAGEAALKERTFTPASVRKSA